MSFVSGFILEYLWLKEAKYLTENLGVLLVCKIFLSAKIPKGVKIGRLQKIGSSFYIIKLKFKHISC